jgi:hypothetical protein
MAPDKHIPVEDFFRPPPRTEASISPDGTRIANLAPWRNRLNVWVRSVESDLGPHLDARCVTADRPAVSSAISGPTIHGGSSTPRTQEATRTGTSTESI